MKKVLKSIVSAFLACACACAAFACGEKADSVEQGEVDNSITETKPDDANNNINDNSHGGSSPAEVPTHYGIKVKNSNGDTVYTTTWDDCKDFSSPNIFCVLPEYRVTLEKNVDYNLNGFMLSREVEDGMDAPDENHIIDDDDDYQTRIYSWDFDCDSEKITIDKTDCTLYEFNFRGLQAGECPVLFTVTYTVTTHRVVNGEVSHKVLKKELAYNLKFIFE